MIDRNSRRTLPNGATFVASEHAEFTVGKTLKGGVAMSVRALRGPLAGTTSKLYFANREALGELAYALAMAAGCFGDTHRAAAAARGTQPAAPAAEKPKAGRRSSRRKPEPEAHPADCTCTDCEIPF